MQQGTSCSPYVSKATDEVRWPTTMVRSHFVVPAWQVFIGLEFHIYLYRRNALGSLLADFQGKSQILEYIFPTPFIAK